MTPRTATETALGVVGVYLLATSIPQAVVSIGVGLSGQNPDPLIRWVGLVAAVSTAAIGAGLTALRHTISVRLAPDTQDHVPGPATNGVHAAAISVVGVYFLAAGLSGLLGEILRSLIPPGAFSTSLMDRYAGPIAETAVGLVLFVGSRGIVGFWHGARSARTRSDA